MSEAITKAQPSAEFNGDWLLREVRFNAQGAVVDWRLPAQPAPSPQAPGRRKGPPGITLEPQGHEPPAVPVVSDERLLREWDRVSHITEAGSRRLAFARAILALRPAVEPMTPLHLASVYAVIDSMGWDLDDQEKDDMVDLVRATEKRHGITAKAEGGA